MPEIPHDSYQTLQMRLANQYGGAAANAVIAPMANAMNDAGMRKMADMMRSAAATPEASTAMQLARDNQMMQNFLGGDAFAGFGLMQQNASAFMQNPMGGPNMGPVANHMAGMNRAAAISNELLYASHIGPNGMTGRTNKQFTQGYSQNELQQLAVELARGGAAAQLGDGSVVSMADGGTSAKDAAMMVSKYAKTARLMADTLGSRDMQEAMADFKKLTGHSMATKGDPGIMRQEIANVANMGEAMGLSSREALQMFSQIRGGINAGSQFNDVLYGRGTMQGGMAATNALGSAMIRGQRMGALQSPEIMQELIKEQTSFEKTMLGTDAAKTTEMITLLNKKGVVDDATMDRIKRATASGDRESLQEAIEDASAAAFGGDTEMLYEVAMDPTKHDKWLQMTKKGMSAEDQKAAAVEAQKLVQTGRRVRNRAEVFNKQMERKSGAAATLADKYGISLDDVDVEDATLEATRRGGEALAKKLREKGDTEAADALESQMRQFESDLKEKGYDDAVDALPEGTLLASVHGLAQGRAQVDEIQKRTKGMIGVDMAEEIRNKVMSEEDKAKFDKLTPEEQQRFARKQLIAAKDSKDPAIKKEAALLAEKAESKRKLEQKMIEGAEDMDMSVQGVVLDSRTDVAGSGAEYEEITRFMNKGMAEESRYVAETARENEKKRFLDTKRSQIGRTIDKAGNVYRQAMEGEEGDENGMILEYSSKQVEKIARDRAKDKVVPPGLKLSGEVRVVKDAEGNDHKFDFKNVEVDEGGE